MGSLKYPFNSSSGTPKTNHCVPNINIINLDTNIHDNNNDYRIFFDKENFERHIEMYPKTEVRKRVLGRVRIPD